MFPGAHSFFRGNGTTPRAVRVIYMGRAQYASAMDEYELLKRLYARAVNRLFAVGYQVTDSEYRKLRAVTDELRTDLQIARREIENESAN